MDRLVELIRSAKDERDLAAIDGMNAFAAAVILSYNSLDEFLEKTPQERTAVFGSLIGVERVVCHLLPIP